MNVWYVDFEMLDSIGKVARAQRSALRQGWQDSKRILFWNCKVTFVLVINFPMDAKELGEGKGHICKRQRTLSFGWSRGSAASGSKS